MLRATPHAAFHGLCTSATRWAVANRNTKGRITSDPSPRPEYLNRRLAFIEIGAEQGHYLCWVSWPVVSSSSLRLAVIPTTLVGSLFGSSVELPAGRVRADPSV